MATGAIYLTEASPGAPALSGTDGTLNAVLDWALVQNGWEIEYTTTNARVYRPGTGNRNRLFVAHDSAISGNVRLATIRGAEDASAATIAGLVNPFPTVAQRSNDTSTILISSLASTAARPYRIVVSPTFLLMAISSTAADTGGWDFFFFGDLAGVEPGDAYATAIHIGGGTSTSAGARAMSGCTHPSLAPGKTYLARSIDGSVSATVGVLGAAITPSGGAAGALMGFNPSRPDMRAGYNSRIEREKVPVRCLGSNTTTASASLQIYQRGWVPNFWALLHSNIGSVTAADVHTDTAYATGSQFVLVPAASGTACLIETSDTWSPP